MRRRILIGIFLATNVASGQARIYQSAGRFCERSAQPQAVSGQVTNVAQAVDRIIAREHNEIAVIRHYSPIVETYIQDMKFDQGKGSIPVHDHYFLGQASLVKGVVDNTMLVQQEGHFGQFSPLFHLSGNFKSEFVPEGFLQMIYVNSNGFDRQHYRFEYVRSEFLGEVKCVVFDVTPLPNSGRGRFKGRIWAENQNYTIVRFNGGYTPVRGLNPYRIHFDSWRLNMQPGLWLPAYIFSQEADGNDALGRPGRFVSQTRLWGYDLPNASHTTEFSEMTVESPTVQDIAAREQDRGPVEAQRQWLYETETNVLDRLQRTGVLAPPGEIDKLLETVVNNLEVTNNLDIEPEVHCRVLLTGTLESFSISHTIVLSRGLIDVLPDEASLATILAQELANLIVTTRSVDPYGFNDLTNVSTVEVLSHFSFRENPAHVEQASEKAVDLLKKSPYKDRLGNAGLFLKQLAAESKSLSALINPHLGNRVFLAQQLIASAPPLQPNKLDQIAALPIGARLRLDPWSDRVALLNTKPVPLYSVREEMPFAITPFMPVLSTSW